jgi:small conductance mechanosensitive channel
LNLRFLGAALVALAPAAAAAQSLPLPIPAPSASSASPYGIPIKRVGNYDTAPIVFQGQRLFTIAAPASAPGDAGIPAIVQRVDTIADNLRRIVPIKIGAANTDKISLSFNVEPSPFDAETFKVVVGSEGGYPTLYAADGHKKETIPIMTVTESDAAVYGQTREQLASQWKDILQTALGPAVLSIEPAYLKSQLLRVPFVLVGAFVATYLIGRLRKYCHGLKERVESEAERIDASDTSSAPEAKRLRQRDSLLSGILWLLTWSVLALWVLVAMWLLTVFPVTRAYANELSARMIRVVILWLLIAVIDRAVSYLIVRVSNAWEVNPFLTYEERSRLLVRRPTVVSAAENLKFIVLYATAIGWTFSILAISTASILTISAVVAFAVSFAAQSIIKDYVNGFLILAEDQFAINDYVTINGITGNVEDLTLRITQIRTDDGKLVTMPNNTIAAVENATRGWSRIDFRVSIANDSDIAKASELLQKTLDQVSADPAWRDTILEPPKVLGVDSVSSTGIVLRAWIRTAPAGKGALAREINFRVDDAFRRNAVAIAIPQTVVVAPSVVEPNGAAAVPAKGA